MRRPGFSAGPLHSHYASHENRYSRSGQSGPNGQIVSGEIVGRHRNSLSRDASLAVASGSARLTAGAAERFHRLFRPSVVVLVGARWVGFRQPPPAPVSFAAARKCGRVGCQRSPPRYIAVISQRRRGGRVAEGARLESVYTGNRIVGSNPTPSAKTLFAAIRAAPLHSALSDCAVQLVPILPYVTTDEMAVPFMNQTPTLPALSIQRMSLLPSPL
jgi:hypothetical protein